MGEAFGEEPLKASARKGGPGPPPPGPEMPYEFADPCPSSMRDVNISDLRCQFHQHLLPTFSNFTIVQAAFPTMDF
jgi:hypothetical protein